MKSHSRSGGWMSHEMNWAKTKLFKYCLCETKNLFSIWRSDPDLNGFHTDSFLTRAF